MELIEKIKIWLATPDLTELEKAIKTVQALTLEAMVLMKSNPALNSELGPLLGKLKGQSKRFSEIEKVDWVNIQEGKLALGHRPSTKLVQDLKLQGTCHIFSLLSESEEAKKIKTLAEKSGMNWIWFPMTSAQAPKETRADELKEVFQLISSVLKSHGKIYIHCSAGIHRTGMITYSLLRYLGYSEKETESLLTQLRTETAKGVGEHRKLWAEELLRILT